MSDCQNASSFVDTFVYAITNDLGYQTHPNSWLTRDNELCLRARVCAFINDMLCKDHWKTGLISFTCWMRTLVLMILLRIMLRLKVGQHPPLPLGAIISDTLTLNLYHHS